MREAATLEVVFFIIFVYLWWAGFAAGIQRERPSTVSIVIGSSKIYGTRTTGGSWPLNAVFKRDGPTATFLIRALLHRKVIL